MLQKHSFPYELFVLNKPSVTADGFCESLFRYSAVKTKHNEFATPMFRGNGQLRAAREILYPSDTDFLNFLI